MGSLTDAHDNAQTMTEELFSMPFVADILLFLRGRQGCFGEELENGACDGRSPEEAFEFLAGKGLTKFEDGKVSLTPKGEEAAEVIDKLEKLMDGQDGKHRWIAAQRRLYRRRPISRSVGASTDACFILRMCGLRSLHASMLCSTSDVGHPLTMNGTNWGPYAGRRTQQDTTSRSVN